MTLAERESPPGTSVSVFICHDAPAPRRHLRVQLEGSGGVTVLGEAGDPVDALPRIAELKPDVIVLDLSMPRMDGLNAIGQVVEHSPQSGIVICSGFLGDVMGPRALQLGADRYVGKDEDFEDILRIICEVARDRRAGIHPPNTSLRGPAEPVQDPLPASALAQPAPTSPAAAEPDRADVLLDHIPTRTSIAAILAMFLLAGVVSVFVDGTQWVGLVCCVPLMIGGIRFGLRSILFTAPLAIAIMTAEHLTDGPASELGWIVAASLAFMGMAAIPGWFSDRAREEIRRREEANRELARSNADLVQFAYVASHDLGEPLRTIHGFTQLLERRYTGRLDEKADRYIENILSGTARLQRLIDDLLEYSRAGRVELDIQWLELDEIVDGVIVTLAASIGASGATVTRDPLPAVHADPNQLLHVVQNLIGNAIKFAREAVVPEIHVSAEHGESEWIVSVRDNGIGLEPGYFERIFQMFQRLHAEHEISGTGIGLAICQRTIERHGGRIWVASTPGRGSTFSFTLPDPT